MDGGSSGDVRFKRLCDPLVGPIVIEWRASGEDADVLRSALDRERQILGRLDGLSGCPRVLVRDPTALELVVADPGGTWLAESNLLGQIDLPRFLSIAESLARLVASIHGRGVFHGAIDPACILIQETDQVWLLDFRRATDLSAPAPASGWVEGDATYRSPEQTGRLGRPVDHRTDLYSLGLVLYALATGAPPFADADPLALVHAHLARDPPSPREKAPWLPEPLARAILILLSKDPDERYRGAIGLVQDLRRIRQAIATGAPLDGRRLRERDPTLAPRPPRRLHGRDRELGTLVAAFMEATEGRSRALFVAGYPGVGKTALIRELQRPALLNGGLFAAGKCDRLQRERPYFPISQSLGGVCLRLMADPDSDGESSRERIRAGLGRAAAALHEILPELEPLLGPRPPAPPLGPLETQGRVRALLVALVRQVATPERPLVLFLDDLQWADRPSLDLIGALLADTAIRGLLLVGAYRDAEVDDTHPLADLVQRLTGTGLAPQVLTLGDLAPGHLAGMVAEMLGTPAEEVKGLGTRLHAKTAGNPFFAIQLVQALHDSGALRIDPDRGLWVWEESALLGCQVSANLADLLALRLGELDEAAAEVVLTAACLGDEVDLGLLSLATALSPDPLRESLAPALRRGILIPTDGPTARAADGRGALRFCHDRMRQAVYELRDDAERAGLHLTIARRLARAGAGSDRLRAAEHFALAASLVAATAPPEERSLARQVLAEAALRARRSGAFSAAEGFLRPAMALLPEDTWWSDPDAAAALHSELHLALCGQARHDEADAIYALLEARAASPERLVDAACIQIGSLCKRTRYRDAIELGCALLERLGVPIPLAELDRTLEEIWRNAPDIFCLPGGPDRAASPLSTESPIARELSALYRHLAGGALVRLESMPELGDARLVGAVRLMDSLLPSANFTHMALVSWLPLRIGRLWIEEGYCETAIAPFASIGPVVIAFRGDYAAADRIARTALEIGAARGADLRTAYGWFVYVAYIGHWCHPVEEEIAQARHAIAELERLGDLSLFAFTSFALLAAMLDTGTRLGELDKEVAAALSAARSSGNRHGEQIFLVYRQLVRSLEGRTHAPGSFTDSEIEECDLAATIERNPTALCYFHIHRALASYLFDDHVATAEHADRALTITHFIHAKYPTALANLVHSLALTQRLRETEASGRGHLLARLELNQSWLAARAVDAPMNFGHLHDLVEAERLDALGEDWAALQAMERAMRRASAHRRPWHCALATERAGRLHMRHGLEHSGRSLLARAHRLYLDWGAAGKAEAMRRCWPFVAQLDPPDPYRLSPASLDQAALLRASEALASATSQLDLVGRVMELVAQLTGATDVRFLALDEQGHWWLEGGLRGSEPLGRMTLAAAEAQALVPSSVLRLGVATRAPVVSDDAVPDIRFAADPHFAGLPLCSLLGLPVVVQGRVAAFLLLENRRLRAVFAAERVVDLLGGVAGNLPLLQSLRFASLGSLVALHSVLDARNQSLRDAHLQAQERAREALEEATRERAIRHEQDRFIDVVTHEYRTPLAILQTNLDILALSRQPTHWQDGLRNMDLAIRRLGEVFDGALRRGDWGAGQPIRMQPIELASWLGQRIHEVRAGWPVPAPTIELGARRPATIQADPALLKTVLLNLLDNARKYGLADDPIRVDLIPAPDAVVLSVGNACRLAPAGDPKSLLAKGHRGANSEGISGLGMGLYLVDKLVADQGGRVEVECSRAGWFEVRLNFSHAHP